MNINDSASFSRSQRATAEKIAAGDEAYRREMAMLPGEMYSTMYDILISGYSLAQAAESAGRSVETIEAIMQIGLDEIRSLMEG